MEILIVVAILGILVSLAVVNYTRSLRMARERDARSMLRLVQAAEETIFGETNGYVACAGNANCNNLLRLTINSAWVFNVALAGNDFVATVSDGVDTYTMQHNWACPTCAGPNCPADPCH